MFVARVEARAHSRATEVRERVRLAVLNLYPEEYRDGVKIRETKTESHHHIPIIVITASLGNRKGCEATLDSLFQKLSKSDRKDVLRTLDLRLNEQCTLFLRIDKQSSLIECVELSNGPDSISVSIHIRQYPRCVQEETRTHIIQRLESIGV